MTPCNYPQGEIVLVPFPFTDQNATKKRPALIVSNTAYRNAHGLCILIPITSNLANTAPGAIPVKGAERAAAGLYKDSLILPHHLVTLHPNRIIKSIGHINPALLAKVKAQIMQHF